MFTQREVVAYLIDRGLIDAKSIVDGEVVVVDVSRRNRNLTVINERGPSYLIKQAMSPDGIATIAHEADVYARLHETSSGSGVSRYLPGFHGYDRDHHLLVLEFLRDAEDLRQYHDRTRRWATSVAAEVGRALASLHLLAPGDAPRGRAAYEPPWILLLPRPGLRMFRDCSSANVQLVKIVQQFPEFGDLLDSLRREWQPSTLIHSDMKWDNCVLLSGRTLKIVDWELARPGDPCWDAGSIFMDYLSAWLFSIPVTGEVPPDRFPELARHPLTRMQPAIRAFWDAYVRGRMMDPETSDDSLVRAVRYGAARLLQTAFEQMQMTMQLTGNVICVLQVSLNILQRPIEAATQLLGIAPRTWARA